MGCIFCEIAAGRVRAEIVFEDEATLAFMDIAPIHRGHTLVIPKRHATDVFEIDPDDAAGVMRTALKVAHAVKAALQCDGVNLFQSNGSAAGQTVYHFHVHVLPRWKGDRTIALLRSYSPQEGDLQRTADQIRQVMGPDAHKFT